MFFCFSKGFGHLGSDGWAGLAGLGWAGWLARRVLVLVCFKNYKIYKPEPPRQVARRRGLIFPRRVVLDKARAGHPGGGVSRKVIAAGWREPRGKKTNDLLKFCWRPRWSRRNDFALRRYLRCETAAIVIITGTIFLSSELLEETELQLRFGSIITIICFSDLDFSHKSYRYARG